MKSFKEGIMFIIVILASAIYLSQFVSAFNYLAPSEVFKINSTTIKLTPVNDTWINFNGNNSNMTIPDNDAYSIPTTGKLAISFWMYNNFSFPGQGAEDEYINFFQKKDYQGGNHLEWEFRMENETGNDTDLRPCRVSFYIFNITGGEGAGAYIQNNDSINRCTSMNNRWNHYVGGFDGNNSFIYINGIKNNIQSGSALSAYGLILQNTNTDILIGRDADSRSPWLNASMDNIQIFNNALDNGKIKQIYAASRLNNNVTKNNYNLTWLTFNNSLKKDYVYTSYTAYPTETSFSFWYYRYNNLTVNTLLASQNSTGFIIRMDANNNLRFFANTSTGASATGGATNASWNHVVVTWNNSNGNVTFYVNGKLNSSSIIASRFNYGGSDNLWIAKRGGADSDMMDGSIDEVRIYNYLLNSTDVSQLNNSGRVSNKTLLTNGLQVYYNFDDGDFSGFLTDYSGNNYTATIYDATWGNDGIILSSQSLTPVTSGIVGHWKLNEKNGSIVNDVINNNNGTLTNTTWKSDDVNVSTLGYIVPFYITNITSARLIWENGSLLAERISGTYLAYFYSNTTLYLYEGIRFADANTLSVCSNFYQGVGSFFSQALTFFILLGVIILISIIGGIVYIVGHWENLSTDGFNVDFKLVIAFIIGFLILAITAVVSFVALSAICSVAYLF